LGGGILKFCTRSNLLYALGLTALWALFLCLPGAGITPDPESEYRYYRLTGDEPHYLLIAHSIAFDGDVDLLNNIRNHDYEAYYNRHVSGYIKHKEYWLPHVRGKLRSAPDKYWRNRALSLCPVGMPALLAPVYRVGYHWNKRVRFAVALWLKLFAACLGLVGLRLAWEVTHNRAAAIVAGLALPLSAPLLFYTWPVYPDLPAALCIALGFLLIIMAGRATGLRAMVLLFATALILGMLLWIHTKFWLHSALLTACLVIETRQSRQTRSKYAWLAFALPLAAALVWVSTYQHRLYGIPVPISTHPGLSPVNGILRGWPGFWFDRDNGLLFYTPLAVLAVPGTVLLWKQKNRMGLWIAGMALAHWLAVGMFDDWRGGRCPPMRYWVPVAALLAVPCAAAVAAVSARWYRVACACTALVGMVIGVMSMQHPGRLYKYRHPVFNRWPQLRYTTLAPRFDGEHPWHTVACTVLCGAAVAAVTVVLLRLAARRDETARDQGKVPGTGSQV